MRDNTNQLRRQLKRLEQLQRQQQTQSASQPRIAWDSLPDYPDKWYASLPEHDAETKEAARAYWTRLDELCAGIGCTLADIGMSQPLLPTSVASTQLEGESK